MPGKFKTSIGRSENTVETDSGKSIFQAHCFTPTKRTHKILHQQVEGLHQRTDTRNRVWMQNTADGLNYFAIS